MEQKYYLIEVYENMDIKNDFRFAGYYTSPEGPENPLSGKLTDLTPIYSDMSFYAYFTEI